jgi:Cdc6-like AAA superfamily ATPase
MKASDNISTKLDGEDPAVAPMIAAKVAAIQSSEATARDLCRQHAEVGDRENAR